MSLTLNIDIKRKHLLAFLIIAVAATIVNYVIAQNPSTQSHPLTEIENPPGSGKTLDDNANNLIDAEDVEGSTFVKVTATSETCTSACGAKTCAFGIDEGTGPYVIKVVECNWGSAPVNWPEYCFCWP